MSAVVSGLACVALLASPAVALAQTAGAEVAAAGSGPVESKPAPPVRVYMRSEATPLTFSVRSRTDTGTATWCISPCDAALTPGDYQLKLNGVSVDGSVAVRSPGTLSGEFHSQKAARTAGWLALNVGGIIGGVFVTVGILGGPSWAYAAGGGSLAAGGVLFLVTYRADRATVSFTPNEPLDVRFMPAPAGTGNSAETPADHGSFASRPRALGFRITF